MQRTLSELAGEAGALAFDLAVTVLLTAVGIEAELFGAQAYGTQTALGLWAGFMGAVALYAGIVVFGGRRLVPRLRAVAAE